MFIDISVNTVIKILHTTTKLKKPNIPQCHGLSNELLVDTIINLTLLALYFPIFSFICNLLCQYSS